jgi:hypothetical protein
MVIAIYNVLGSAETEGILIYSWNRCEKGFAFDFVVLGLVEGREAECSKTGIPLKTDLEFLVLFVSFSRRILQVANLPALELKIAFKL